MKIEFYEPPMCCATGICGPNVDEKLIRLAQDIEDLQNKYISLQVERYQISRQPLKFKSNSEVFSLIQKEGRKTLPITTINGAVFKAGSYPTLEEMERQIENLNKL